MIGQVTDETSIKALIVRKVAIMDVPNINGSLQLKFSNMTDKIDLVKMLYANVPFSEVYDLLFIIPWINKLTYNPPDIN